MKLFKLNEDKQLQPYDVWFTPNVRQDIKLIKAYNHNNIEGIEKLEDYLDGLITYISKPVLAWDNIAKYPHVQNGATHVRELDYNFTYFIRISKFNNHEPYVCINKIYFDFDFLELKNPFDNTSKTTKTTNTITNIKPNKDVSPERNISIDRNGNYMAANDWGADYVSENIQYNKNTNRVKRTIRLNESDFERLIDESVRRVLKERRNRRLDESIDRSLRRVLREHISKAVRT